MTLTSFSKYDELFSFEKITKDLEDMIAELKDPQFDFHEYLKQAKIKCGSLYIIRFGKIPMFIRFLKFLEKKYYDVNYDRFYCFLRNRRN